jgi:hypothetical protein
MKANQEGRTNLLLSEIKIGRYKQYFPFQFTNVFSHEQSAGPCEISAICSAEIDISQVTVP